LTESSVSARAATEAMVSRSPGLCRATPVALSCRVACARRRGYVVGGAKIFRRPQDPLIKGPAPGVRAGAATLPRIVWRPMSESGTGRPLGGSGFSVPVLGVGTNRWNASGPDQVRLRDTLTAALDAGMGLFDTAEAYNAGRSEIALGQAARADGRPVMLASKFAPFPYRVSTAQFASALDKTLERLGRDSLDLYYLHFPYFPRGVGTWMRAMARVVKAGKIRAVGISNCNVIQMRKAAGVLARYGIPLAANQVHCSLLHRKPETDGVLGACRRMDVALVDYRQGPAMRTRLPTMPHDTASRTLARLRTGPDADHGAWSSRRGHPHT
jgi:diketogulonate reductase-like aldo/keto reductase